MGYPVPEQVSIAYPIVFLSFWQMAQYKLKCCLKEPMNLKQLTNQFYYPMRTSLTFYPQTKRFQSILSFVNNSYPLYNLHTL